MKKILYAVLAALMLISCDPNAPKLPSKDNKAIDNLSKNLLSLVGEKKKAAVSTLEGFGFEQIDDLGTLPQRLGLPAQKEATNYISFVYGNIEVYEEALEEEDIEIVTDYLTGNNEAMIFVTARLDDSNKVSRIDVNIVASQDVKNINGMYAKFSKNVFLSLGEDKEWAGVLAELEDYEDEGEKALKEYSSAKKRDKFEADFAAMEWPLVEEYGSDEFDDDARRYYEAEWVGDASLMSKEMDGLATATIEVGLLLP